MTHPIAPARGSFFAALATCATRRARVALMFAAAAFIALSPSTASAQAGVLRGTVTDSAGRGLRDVEVLSINTDRSTRTDENGRFTLSKLPWGQQVIMARLPGYRAAEQAVTMLDEKTPPVSFVLYRNVQLVDTVRITSHDGCPAYDISGFACRKRAGVGQFRGEEEIAALRPYFWADMFEGLEGFRRTPVADPRMEGRRDWQIESTTGWRCLAEGWNGREKTAADELVRPKDIVAIEHYDVYEKVPAAYKRLAWPRDQEKPCALVMYWTRDFVEREQRRP